jgi:hypothetical protein
MGWATTVPEFRQLGLYLEKRDGGMATLCFAPGGQDTCVYRHFDAAALFFGITTSEAEYMFAPDEYPGGEDTTRMEVVDRIGSFLVNGMPDSYDRLEEEEDEDEDFDEEEEDEDDFDDEDDDLDEDI